MSTPTVKQTRRRAVAEPAPVQAEVTPAEPSVAETASAVTETVVATESVVESMRQRFENLIKSKQDLMAELKREIQELKRMQKDHEHEVRDASKKSKKKKAPSENRKPSGFASPVIVSDALYKFLEQFEVSNGTPIARTTVTSYVTRYIREHNLQNPAFKREIIPDSRLKAILGEPIETEPETNRKRFTYLKLQVYLSQHFPRKAAAVVESAAE